MIDKNNNWINDRGMEQINYYLNSNDVILIERKRTIKLLMDIFQYHFENRENLMFLDLGCGDGVISKILARKYPNNQFELLDGSEIMLNKAKKELQAGNFIFLFRTFEDYIAEDSDELKYDFIYSSMAIHHLDILNKNRLYSKIFRVLKSGGLFLNIDVVLPPSEKSEKWQFRMWRDWMNETLSANNRRDEIGTHDNLPENYKNKPENKPGGLFDQLEALRQTGFRDADCFYKYGIFALFGGTK